MSDESLLSARVALWSFRRDTATSPAAKIQQQELIIGLQEKKLATLKGRAAAGVVGREEILLATDAFLQAQQTLEKLRLPLKKGVRVEWSSPYGADARLRRAGESPSIRP